MIITDIPGSISLRGDYNYHSVRRKQLEIQNWMENKEINYDKISFVERITQALRNKHRYIFRSH